jgi:hypothetical protein
MAEDIDELIAKGDAAYGAMYDCRPYDLKDLRDDALGFFARALDLARAAGRAALVQDLETRMEKVQLTYRQLRT